MLCHVDLQFQYISQEHAKTAVISIRLKMQHIYITMAVGSHIILDIHNVAHTLTDTH